MTASTTPQSSRVSTCVAIDLPRQPPRTTGDPISPNDVNTPSSPSSGIRTERSSSEMLLSRASIPDAVIALIQYMRLPSQELAPQLAEKNGMSIAKYRKTLTLETIGGARGVMLYCLLSEKKSVIKHYPASGDAHWMRENITAKHPNGTPKILHVPISQEGIYQIFGQPTLAGLYCFYFGSSGLINYAPISASDRTAIETARNAGSSYRDALIALNKRVF